MRRITAGNYRTDKYYPGVVRAAKALLVRSEVIAPLDLFVEMNLLEADAVARWRAGHIPSWNELCGAISRRRAGSCASCGFTRVT
jgi:hypothetical protein